MIPHTDIIGHQIINNKAKHQWKTLVGALHDAYQEGGPLEHYLFHGTSLKCARYIQKEGVHATEVLMQDEDDEDNQCWTTTGTYWANPLIAAFYAEDKQYNNPNIKLAIIACPKDHIISEGIMAIDLQSLDCPLCDRLGKSEDDILNAWEGSEQTWEDCIRIYGSAVCLSPIGPEKITVIKTLEDIYNLIEAVRQQDNFKFP
jgi:hypothetical protein